MSRAPLVVGNQKLYLGPQDARDFARWLAGVAGDGSRAFDVAVCPSFIGLAGVCDVLRGTSVGCGAQNVHREASGAYTGQASIEELLELGIGYVIVGHSEVRSQLGETDGDVNAKVKMCLARDLTPIACVGETRADRDAGRSRDVIGTQVRALLAGVDAGAVGRLVIAYEPLWAIKSGLDDRDVTPATPEQAEDAHAFIRAVAAGLYDERAARAVRVIYGGSVDADNATGFLAQPSVDGLLIGSASVKRPSFARILESVQAQVGAGA